MSAAISIPGYEILKPLGEGGMSHVYLAMQQSLERQVALKIMNPALAADDAFRERFLREGRVIAQLDHSHIVSVYDIGVHESHHYMVIQYIDGGTTLKDRIRDGINEAAVVAMLGQIASALGYAHQRGFVHRDVKPGNILFDQVGNAVLSDFGIVKAVNALESEQTQAGFVIGTPEYMSPEQMQGEEVDARGDLYSLGIVFHEALVGQKPYQASDPIAAALKHANEPIPRLPKPLTHFQPIIDKLLAKAPSNRFQNAEELLFALDGLSRSSMLSRAWRAISGLIPKTVITSQPSERSVAISAADQNSNRGSTMPERAGVTMMVPAGSDFSIQMGDVNPFAGEYQADATSLFQAGGTVSDDIPVALLINACADLDLLGQRVDIDHFPFVLGRGDIADLKFESDRHLSRAHCQINCVAEGFRIVDQSKNGIFVNGRPVPSGNTAPLLYGDSIALSRNTSVTLVANVEQLPDFSGEVLDGRYRLVTRRYSSIKACTYLAEDQKFKRQLAVKVFSPSFNRISHFAEAFRQQSELAATLTHPHIARVLETGVARVTVNNSEQNLPYLCMESMSGGNLQDKLTADQPPGLEILVDWLSKLAQALEYVHAKKIVHGALKPSAVVFDDNDNPYLTDFSTASVEGTSSGSALLGSPFFISPEQWENEPLTRAGDQYSLAVLTYLLIADCHPFEGQSDPEVRRRNFTRPPLPVHLEAARNGREGTPSSISTVLGKALSVQPDDRYESVQAFVDAFTNAAHGRRSNGKTRAFISYHRGESAGWAQLFAKELREKHDIEPYVDTQALDRAARFPERLKNAIIDCDVVVCILGNETLSSKWVQEEIRIAYEHDKPMVPVFQEGFDHPNDDDGIGAHLRAMLSFDGVHLLDQRNIHVEHTIADLARMLVDMRPRNIH